MQISDEALDEFMAMYQEEFKETLTREAASAMAQRVLTLYERLARRLPTEHTTANATPPQEEPRRPIGFHV